ncbi:MAG: EboA domain-containing protein [Planctomycetes bacterium]|nr:EboA domain-containing protein [Planctomycetota bacterium]
MSDFLTVSSAILDRHSPRMLGKFTAGFDRLRENFDLTDFLAVFGAASRWIGKDALIAGDAGELSKFDPEIDFASWMLDDLARASMLVFGVPRSESLLAKILETAEMREHAAVLKALSLFDPEGNLHEIGEEGVRTNIRDVFRGIASGNPYPKRSFSDLAFNQLVLKALFIEVPVSSIVGLAERWTHALGRMAEDYRAERAAAGREVFEDIETVINKGVPRR